MKVLSVIQMITLLLVQVVILILLYQVVDLLAYMTEQLEIIGHAVLDFPFPAPPEH